MHKVVNQMLKRKKITVVTLFDTTGIMTSEFCYVDAIAIVNFWTIYVSCCSSFEN